MNKKAKLVRHGEGFETSPAPNRNGSYEDHVMAAKALLSPKVLRQLLRYEPETGKLFWRNRIQDFAFSPAHADRWNRRYAGKEAMTANSRGYLRGRVLNMDLPAHRVVWAIHFGEWPEHHIDHINGVRSDNRIENLRSVTNHENHKNVKKPKNNTSGVVGVSWQKRMGKWQSRIKVNGKTVNLGSFDVLSDAKRARKTAEAKFGFHPNHGQK